MRRYFLKPKGAAFHNDPDAEDYLARTVYQQEPRAFKTGILDAQGNDIYCTDEPEPIGFVNWNTMIRFKPLEDKPMKKKPAPKAPAQKPMPAKKQSKGKKR